MLFILFNCGELQVADMLGQLQPRLIFALGYYHSQCVEIPQNLFYRTVRDTGEYPLFIPWCKRSAVTKYISAVENYTELSISFKHLKQISYTSHVLIQERQEMAKITSVCRQRPLKYLQSVWTFEKESEMKTKVTYSLDFQFDSILYQLTSSIFLKIMGKSMWDIFLRRALHLHRSGQPSTDQSNIIQNSAATISKGMQHESTIDEQVLTLMAADPQTMRLYSSDRKFEQQVHRIVRRLKGTSNFQSKLRFEVNNLLSHWKTP